MTSDTSSALGNIAGFALGVFAGVLGFREWERLQDQERVKDKISEAAGEWRPENPPAPPHPAPRPTEQNPVEPAQCPTCENVFDVPVDISSTQCPDCEQIFDV